MHYPHSRRDATSSRGAAIDSALPVGQQGVGGEDEGDTRFLNMNRKVKTLLLYRILLYLDHVQRCLWLFWNRSELVVANAEAMG